MELNLLDFFLSSFLLSHNSKDVEEEVDDVQVDAYCWNHRWLLYLILSSYLFQQDSRQQTYQPRHNPQEILQTLMFSILTKYFFIQIDF